VQNQQAPALPRLFMWAKKASQQHGRTERDRNRSADQPGQGRNGETGVSDLQRLIEAVEAGRDDSNLWRPALGDAGVIAMQAHHGSIDAAKRLHDALLPGWDYHLWNMGADGAGADVAHYDSNYGQNQDSAIAPNPGRAWLLAILWAVAEQNGTETRISEHWSEQLPGVNRKYD
jgi:hypothetical protein